MTEEIQITFNTATIEELVVEGEIENEDKNNLSE